MTSQAPARTMNGCRPMLYFTNSTLWGGVEEHICGLLRRLSRNIFRAHLVCDPTLYERFRDAIPADVQITALALSSPKHVAAAARFAGLVARGRYQIVHSHMFWSSLFASPIAWACRVPIIVETLHGTEAWRTGWKANRMVDRATSRFISKYIAVCDSDARFLRNQKHVASAKIAIIPNGIDTGRFTSLQDARIATRRALGFTEGDPVLIVVARFHAGKGHSVLLNAMRQLVHSYPKLKLICLGEGQGEEELRILSERLGLTHCVRFVGYQRNVPEWLAAADINVLPTFYEGLPLTVLEAMASGLATVASNVGGIPEAIEDGVSGLLVPPRDPKRLAEALSFLLRDVPARMRIGQVARERVVQKFGIEQQVSRTERMYVELCDALRSQATEWTASPGNTEEWSSTPVRGGGSDIGAACADFHEACNTRRF